MKMVASSRGRGLKLSSVSLMAMDYLVASSRGRGLKHTKCHPCQHGKPSPPHGGVD